MESIVNSGIEVFKVVELGKERQGKNFRFQKKLLYVEGVTNILDLNRYSYDLFHENEYFLTLIFLSELNFFKNFTYEIFLEYLLKKFFWLSDLYMELKEN